MAMNYTFRKDISPLGTSYYSVLVEKPWNLLNRLTAHNWSSHRIEKDVIGTQQVITGQLPEYIWGSEAIYLVATANGTNVYDSFDKEETPLFTITNEEALKFLQDFKAFLESQGV